MLRTILLTLALLIGASTVYGQGRSYDQELLGRILDQQGSGILPDHDIEYRIHTLTHGSGNSVIARHTLYKIVGEGDAELGRERLAITRLLSGVALTDLAKGDTIVLPANSRDYDLDPRAFAPFPQDYPGAREIDKIIIVDKDLQAWAAYEYGTLVRWGPASSGSAGTPTPTGRFTMNWRQLERISSESPPGEEWRMRYVMNIHNARGIHLHQYDDVPAGPPVGAGCVRMVTADAEWMWEWTEPWTTTAGVGVIGGRVLEEGTLVIVQGDEPPGHPVRFTYGPDGPKRVMTTLPPDPMEVPRGDR